MKQNVVTREEQATELDYVDDMCDVYRQAATALIVANGGETRGWLQEAKKKNLGLLGLGGGGRARGSEESVIFFSSWSFYRLVT